MNANPPREQLERAMRLAQEMRRRKQRALHASRGWIDENGVLQGGLMQFTRDMWHTVEPDTELVEGWALYAVVQHLEAVTFGEIRRLLINVPPGFMKSLLTCVFWPAWEWGPMNRRGTRYVTFAYSAGLTERDNGRFRDVISHADYRQLYPKVVPLKVGEREVSNTGRGWKRASSVTGSTTGWRGHRVVCFPRHETIQTEYGPRTIGDLVDEGRPVRVWSYNETMGAMELRPVSRFMKNPGSPVLKVTTQDGTSFECTPNHEIRTARGYVRADQLRSTDKLFAAPRGMFVSAPTVRRKQVKVEVLPYPSISYSRDSLVAHTKLSGQLFGGFRVACRNLADQILSKVHGSIFERAVSFTVGDVLSPGAIFEIIQRRVRSVAVFVSDFLSCGARSNECAHNELMQKSVMGFAALSQRDSRVSLVHAWGGISARNDDMAFPARYSARNTPYAAGLGDKVVVKSGDCAPRLVGVRSVEFSHHAPSTFCLTVEGNHNLVVGRVANIICSNCDDPHNVKDVESEDVRDSTVRWFRESMSSRLNDVKTSAIVVIMQRVHEYDVSGMILAESFDYVHLQIPMHYDWTRHCVTEIGWQDPRGLDDDGEPLVVIDEETGERSPRDDDAAVLLEEERDGELAWPERFPPEYLPQMMAEIGPYAVAGQLQQAPTPRGGGIFQRAWWQPWETDSYPEFSFILASLDTAFTEKEQNDPSALTVWGVFDGPDGMPKTMLIDAWRKRLEMHGSLPLQMFGEKDVRGQPNREYLARCEMVLPRQPRESDLAYYARVKDAWGLVEWVAYTCRRMRVNRLIIENKTGGITAAQELQRIHGMEGYGIELHTPHGDKVARALAVQPIFSQGMVFAPPYEFAETVIQEMENFPRGRYKDLTDSSTQAVKWLRDNGFADRPEELRFQEDQRRQLRRASKPLYGVR